MDTYQLPLSVEWKAAGGPGELEGYIASFGTVDLGGDVIMPGALRKTINDWNSAKAKMPLMVDHDLSWNGVIGVVTHMAEDSYGARVHARFASDPTAQGVRQKMLDTGGSGMSLTWLPVRTKQAVRNGQAVREIYELKAIEATVTWVPMNAMAYASAKSAGGAEAPPTAAPEPFEAFRDGMAHALAIGDVAASRAAVDTLIDIYRPPAAGAPDGDATANTAATAEAGTVTDEPSGDDDYALRFVSHSEPPDGALAITQATENERLDYELDALEADIQRRLGDAT